MIAQATFCIIEFPKKHDIFCPIFCKVFGKYLAGLVDEVLIDQSIDVEGEF